MKKLMALLAALAMIVTVIPVHAEGAVTYAVDGGALEETFAEINTAEDEEVVVNVSGTVTWTTGAGHGSTPLITAGSKAKTVIIDGNGTATLEAIGQGVGPLRAANDGTLIFKNLTIKDSSVSYAEGSWEFGYLEFGGNLVFENCSFVNAIQVDQDNGNSTTVNAEFTNCTFNSNKTSEYALWFGQGNLVLDGCTFTGPRGLKVHEAYGSDVSSVTVKNSEFINISQKPGIAIGDLDATTTVTVDNCTFIACQTEDGNIVDGGIDGIFETDTDISTFNFTVTNSTVEMVDNIVTTEEELRTAITNGDVNEDGIIEIYVDESFSVTKALPNSSVPVHIMAYDRDEKLTFTQGEYSSYGQFTDITFKDLGIAVSNANYKGFYHTGTESYINCTIEGNLWTYGVTANFKDCTFK